MGYGYESGYGTDATDTPAQTAPQYGFETDYGGNQPQIQDSAQKPSNYSWAGLASNVLPDIGRQIAGTAMQVKQGLYDIPKDVLTAPVQVLRGTPIRQTDLANFTRQNTQAMADGLKQMVQHPIDWAYQNPVSTALLATGIASKALPMAENMVTKGISSALGPSQEAIEARLANPEAIRNASSYGDLAHKLPETLNQLKDQISAHADQASSLLRDSYNPTEGAVPKSQVNNIFGNIIADLKIKGSLIGPGRQAAVKTLQALADDINSIGSESQFLSEMDVKNVIQSVDKNINWQDKGASETNAALTDFRAQLDQILKKGSDPYAKAMLPVADKTGLLYDLKKAFSLTNVTGEGIQPTDATVSKLQSLPTEKKSITQDTARRLAQATGEDYIQHSKNYGYAKQFSGGTTQGSRKVNLYGAAGAALGSAVGDQLGMPGTGAFIGSSGGAALGALMDKYGGNVAGYLTDIYSPMHARISQLISSSPIQFANRAALTALVNQYLQNQNASAGAAH